jgi:site-specific DNA-cytosine methylase
MHETAIDNYSGRIKEFKTVHFCGGIGGCSLGMQQSLSEYRGVKGIFRTLFSVDVDAGACRAYEQLTGSKAVCADIFNREQYKMFHGAEPPESWRAITATDLREWGNNEYPDVIFISAPCKGFSRLLPNAAAQKPKYQALNKLAIRALALAMEAWGDNPPSVILFENVPGIESRGAHVLAEIRTLLGSFGYVFHEGHHDCGEIGHLGQRRIRYLMIARNPKKLPSFIYQPPKYKHRTIGDILGPLPMPGDTERGGPMHRLPNLAWRTWERLALIPAGKDWRALKDLNHTPQNGTYRIVPWNGTAPTVTTEAQKPGNASFVGVADPRISADSERFGSNLKVSEWDEVSPTITGARLDSGSVVVADPRIQGHEGKFPNAYQVQDWGKPSPAIIGQTDIQTGALSVADPRTQHYNNILKVMPWDEPSASITGGSGMQSGGLAVADPRFTHPTWRRTSVGKVAPWDEPAGAIIANPNISGAGTSSVADPRISDKWSGAGNYKIMPWDEPANAVTACGDIHAGAAAVSDPRIPGPDDRGTWIIVAMDGTWHRPITTFEMAMLQGLPWLVNGKPLVLPGNSDSKWREWIGNMVPVQAGTAMGNALLATMMPNCFGDWHWDVDGNELWVRPESRQKYTVA